MITGHLNTFRHGSRINFWWLLKQIKNSSCFLPGGKVDDAPSPSLPRTRSKILRLRPWTPWIWGALGFCNNRDNIITSTVMIKKRIKKMNPVHLWENRFTMTHRQFLAAGAMTDA